MDTSANSQALIAEYLSRGVLDRAEPELTVHKQGRLTNIPQGESKTARWVRYGSVAGNTTPLTEKTTPAETAITTSDVQVIAQQYGQWACVSDVLKDTSRFDNLKQARDILADSAKKTIEQLAINEIDSEGYNLFVNGAANADALTATDTAELEDFICAMELQRIDNLDAHRDGDYTVILNKAVTFDVLVDTTGVSHFEAMKGTDAGRRKIESGEIGRLYGMRFLESGLMSSNDNAGSVPIKNSFVFAFEPFGVVDIRSQGIKIMMTDGRPTDGDPLAQRQKVGYKLYYATKYLEPSSKRAVIVQSAASKG